MVQKLLMVNLIIKNSYNNQNKRNNMFYKYLDNINLLLMMMNFIITWINIYKMD